MNIIELLDLLLTMLPEKFRIYVGIPSTEIVIPKDALPYKTLFSSEVCFELYKLRNPYYDTLYRIVLYSKEFNDHEKV